ncbi:hypothetical protein RZS08_36110, partial [Arthrospira platensis SPKY1]|nr:hypothetical protein [Arthrospira platensis SPKY1]
GNRAEPIHRLLHAFLVPFQPDRRCGPAGWQRPRGVGTSRRPMACRRSDASREPFVAPATPIAFNPSRLAPLLQGRARCAVGATQVASLSSYPPTPIAFNPSRLA